MRWLAGQLALAAAVVWAGRGGRWHPLAGGALSGAGAALMLAGSRALGPDLRPQPEPRPGGRLHEEGPYRLVRHPIYAGLALAALGWALWHRPRALLPAAALAVFLDRKAQHEETLLERAHPAYAEYRQRVRGRLVPLQ